MWKGSISFGLVNIPIKMFAATEDKDIRFRYIHSKCKTPIRYEKVCPACNKEIEQDDIVRGYEYEPGQFVVIDDKDIEALKSSTGKAIEILDFVDLKEIDPIYFSKSYYLSPQDTGGKAYHLLREAMSRSGRIAIARITIREKQSLAVLRVYKNLMVLETIFYPDEVRDIAQVPDIPEKVELDEKELKMAEQLISNLTTAFEPDKYSDEYRRELRELINRKIEGNEVIIPEAPQRNVIDLMQALQESLRQTEKGNKSVDEAVKEVKKKKGSRKKTTAG